VDNDALMMGIDGNIGQAVLHVVERSPAFFSEVPTSMEGRFDASFPSSIFFIHPHPEYRSVPVFTIPATFAHDQIILKLSRKSHHSKWSSSLT